MGGVLYAEPARLARVRVSAQTRVVREMSQVGIGLQNENRKKNSC